MPSVRSIEELPQRGQRGVGAQERLQELLGALARQRVDAELRVVGPAPPGVLVLGAVVDEEQEAGGGERVDQAVEPRLGLRVDPVQILEDQQQRLDLALAEQQAPDGVERVLPALARVERRPTARPRRARRGAPASAGSGGPRGSRRARRACPYLLADAPRRSSRSSILK